MSEKVIVGLSGGVDSSVSALRLKEAGYRVEALFMKNWEDDDEQGHCHAEQDLNDAQAVCHQLQIPLHTVNFSEQYWDSVFYHFLEALKQGYTPNPDILCNRAIKFDAFLKHAKHLGADKIAMGHYAQTDQTHLLCAVDDNKDQTYFLSQMPASALKDTLFPIGDLPKQAVRELATKHGLSTSNKKDSTGICFIGKRKFSEFIQNYLHAQPGVMKSPDGKVIGEHQGLMHYTLGQRQGLGIGGPGEPWYVVGKSLQDKILWVTQGHHHPWRLSNTLTANMPNWLPEPPKDGERVLARMRHRQAKQEATVTQTSDGFHLIFDTPQVDVTPGQAVVLYQNNRCLGGGIISETDSPGGLNL